MKITKIITVTQKHINKGIQTDAQECPIAKALRTAGLRNVSVSGMSVYFGKGWKRTAELPKRARNFIKKFDNEKPVKPFTFRLTY